ncbi:two-component regulator propeller domain-containing protein [Massilia sp. W12]|uniref:sensor histidine kinase n=1 Tax=Massilia sp. W12 TaxID=3126507 RepID=UPI0030D3A666
MPHGVATAIAQDQEGFLWIGTQGGLARWDGYHFRVYQADPRIPHSLPDDLVQVLHLDARGRLWVGTAGGLARYDAAQDQFVRIGPEQLGNPSVYALADDGLGGLWVGNHGGLDHLNAEGRRIQGPDLSGMSDKRVQALWKSADGSLWIGSGRGLFRLQQNRLLAQALPADSIPDIRALFLDEGQLWIGSARHGAFVLDLASAKVEALHIPQSGLERANINSIRRHDKDEIWLGSFGQGIYAIHPREHSLRMIRHDPSQASSLADDNVLALYQDNSGLLWVASQSGLSRHDPRQSAMLNLVGNPGQPGKIGDRDVWSVLPRKDGSYWLGLGNNGVDLLHPQRGVIASLRPDAARPQHTLPATLVLAMVEAGPWLYIGSNRGLYRHRIGSNSVQALPLAPRKPLDAVKTLTLADGRLWIGGSDGVWSVALDAEGGLDPAQPAALAPFSAQLSDMRITCFMQDRQRRFWIGTWNGLNLYDPVRGRVDKIMPEPKRMDGLAHGFITSLLQDAQGRIWIGASGGGLHLWQGYNSAGQASMRHFDQSHGLPNPIIGQILQDQAGNIWVSTDGGLARIHGRSFSVQALQRADGVQFPAYWSNSGAVGAGGELLFGASGGLSVIRPEQVRQWDYRPELVITDLRIGGKRIPASMYNQGKGRLELGPHNNSIAVEFAALDYSAPEKNRYAYQLEGFDSEWLETEPARRLASYTNLPPGEYKLRLRGSNRNGVWNESGLELHLSVQPDWFESLWFRSLLVAAGAIAVLLLVQVRTTLLRQQRRGLAVQVAQRTSELQQQQQALLQANRDLQRANQDLANSANTLRELGEIGREITANLELDAVFTALHRHVRQLLDAPTFSLYRADLNNDCLEYVFGREDERALPATSIALNSTSSNAARCARERREILLELEAGQLNPSPIPGTRNMLTLLFAPLVVDQRLLGVMSIQSDHPHAYGERERTLFRNLCAYGAIALENGNAYRRLREAQDRLVAQEKLAALGGLVAGVAHELNTPLGNSLMMASAMQENVENLLQQMSSGALRAQQLHADLQDAQEAAQVLMRNLRNAAHLVNSFKQVAVDRTSSERRMFDLRETSLDVLATLSNAIRAHGHEIEIDIPPDLILESYPGPYGQVLAHLVENALLHAYEGRSGGHLRLSARRLQAGRVEIMFADDGCGISAQDQKHIFDPFFTTKLAQGGIGLGLSVCYNIVSSLLNGQIRVHSQAGQGACFVLDLPLVAGDEAH